MPSIILNQLFEKCSLEKINFKYYNIILILNSNIHLRYTHNSTNILNNNSIKNTHININENISNTFVI